MDFHILVEVGAVGRVSWTPRSAPRPDRYSKQHRLRWSQDHGRRYRSFFPLFSSKTEINFLEPIKQIVKIREKIRCWSFFFMNHKIIKPLNVLVQQAPIKQATCKRWCRKWHAEEESVYVPRLKFKYFYKFLIKFLCDHSSVKWVDSTMI